MKNRVNQVEGRRGPGRMFTEAYDKGRGANGQLRYVTRRKVPESGSVLSALLKRLPGLTTRRRSAFVATRPSSTFLHHLKFSHRLGRSVHPNSLSQLGHPPGQLGHSPPPSSLCHSHPPSLLSRFTPPSRLSHSLPPGRLSHTLLPSRLSRSLPPGRLSRSLPPSRLSHPSASPPGWVPTQ